MSIEDKIRQEPLYILCVENPSEDLVLLSIANGGIDIAHLFLTDKIFDIYFSNPRGFEELYFVKSLDRLSENRLKDILLRDYTLIEKLSEPSEMIQIFAINRNPEAILYIENASEKAWRTAVRKKPELIENLYDPPESIQIAAVKSDPTSIKYIDTPTKKVQLYVAKLSPEYIGLIKNIDSVVACKCLDLYGLSVIVFLRKTDSVIINTIKKKIAEK